MSPQDRAQYAIEHLMTKQAKGELGGLGYMIPFYGAALSGRDTLKSLAWLRHNLLWGHHGAAVNSGLGVLGNGAMTLADFLPFVGPTARGVVGVGKAAKGTKFLRGLKAGDKIRDFLKLGPKASPAVNYFGLAHGAKPSQIGFRKLVQTPFATVAGGVHRHTNKLMPRALKDFISRRGLTYQKMQGQGMVPWLLSSILGQNPYQ
jgi:hypothetical protein